MKVLGIVAARGGSKRLPRKNVLPLAGRPLIEWTLRAALESGVVDRLIVSTDCPEIAAAAEVAGAEVPFLRPPELATDSASGVDVILHALDFIEQHGDRPEWILCLQATSPLRTARDIREMLQVAQNGSWREAASFRPARTPPPNLWKVSATATTRAFPQCDAERQQMEAAGEWFGEPNGAMYLIDRNLFVERRGFFTEHLRAFPMPEARSVDIDTEVDFILAEALLKRGLAGNESRE